MDEFDCIYKYRNQYYIDLVKLSPQKTAFPTEYDMLCVEYHGVRRNFPRTKTIDRLLKKSPYIYSNIDDISDCYMFIFYNNGSEIGRIKYSDIAYPDHAVKLANEVMNG